MKKLKLCAVGIIAPMVWLAGVVHAETVTLNPAKDNTLIEMAGWPDLSSGQGDLFAGGIAQQNQFGNAMKRRALMQFPIGSIPAGSTITGVSLTMQMTKTIAGTYQFNLYRMTADWGEGASNSGGQGSGVGAAVGDATWNLRFYGDPSSAWITPGGDFSPVISGSTMVGGVGAYTWTGGGMVQDVQDWVNGVKPNYGWMLTSHIEALTSIAKRFTSREGSVNARPRLVVTYTPVPAPGVGVVVAGGLLAATRRRRGR